MKKISLFIAAALISVAAFSQSWSEYIEPIKLDDNFKPNVLVSVKNRVEGQAPLNKTISLSSEIRKKTGQGEYGLTFLDAYRDTGWRRWARATTEEAESLKTHKVINEVVSCRNSSSLGGCAYMEGLIIELPPALIQKAAKEPVRIQIRGDVQEYIYTFKPEEVQALLAAEADTKQKLSK